MIKIILQTVCLILTLMIAEVRLIQKTDKQYGEIAKDLLNIMKMGKKIDDNIIKVVKYNYDNTIKLNDEMREIREKIRKV